MPAPLFADRRVCREAILYDRRNGRAHVIIASAARVWDLCDGRAMLDDITGALAAAYNLPPASVRDDVVQIITSFRELRVLD